MLENALFSVASSWDNLPNLRVVSDGTLAISVIKSRLRWWPTELEVLDWESYARRHEEDGRSVVSKYARAHSFGRKFAVALLEAKESGLLWIDTDILFFNDFSRELAEIDHADSTFLFAAEDWALGYDQNLHQQLPHLPVNPSVNTGLMLGRGDYFTAFNLGPLVEQALVAPNVFTEQTLLAQVLHQCGRMQWNLQQIAITGEDVFSFRPTYRMKAWRARHYVTPHRHLFWRDAWALRRSHSI